MRRASFIGGLLLLPGLAARAQPLPPLRLAPSEEQRRLSHQLIEAFGYSSVLEQVYPVVRQNFVRVLRERGLSDADAALAYDQLIQPEFVARRGEIMQGLSAPFAQHFTAAQLIELLTVAQAPIMQRQREAMLGGRRLNIPEWIELFRLRRSNPALARLLETQSTVEAEMAEGAKQAGGRIAEQAFMKHINALRHRGLRL